MVSGFEITCANKNQRGLIIRIGGEGWSMGVREAIVKVMSKQVQLHILIDGKPVEVGVRGDGFDAYLALASDGFPLHNLVDLPSC